MSTRLLTPVVVLAAALLLAWSGSAPASTLAPAASGAPDLDVTFINRAPLYYPYCIRYHYAAPETPGRPYLCPGSENDQRWPEKGEVVTFTAHVANKGAAASPAFGYAWYIDGAQVVTGTLPGLAPAGEATATYQWPWAHDLSPDGQAALGEHTVRFTADPANAVAEAYESNNTLEDRTNAMSFSVYMTPEAYAAYNVPVDPKYPHSAEDWLQKQIAAMNSAFANSIYPVTPHGMAIRVRVDTFAVVASDPDFGGHQDGSWYLRDDVRHSGGYYEAATDIDWGLVHELSHQVSLIDMYAMGVYSANVLVQKRDGYPVNAGFSWSNGGLMFGGDTAPHNDPHLYDSESAGGASTFAGYRNGYYGAYLFDIPLQNYLRVLDNQGNPAPGVAVSIYQRTGPSDAVGHMSVDDIAEMSGVTGDDGVYVMPDRSANGGTVTANGHVMHDNPFGVVDIIGNQGLLLVKLARGGHEEFHWLDITQFNQAFWLGDTNSHIYTIASHVPPPAAPAAPVVTLARAEGTWASLDWEPGSAAAVAGYRVYRAAAPRYEYEAASDLLAGTHFEEFASGRGDGEHRMYAVTAVDDAGRESGFDALVYIPGLDFPAAVATAPGGTRLVLNRGNLYPLLGQQPDGRYTHRPVNVHYDFGSAHSLAFDPLGRLVVSGFGESPAGRKAVRVYDTELRPVLAFGDSGGGPGQFGSPTGAAFWGEPWAYGGPYSSDSHTLLLLHFDGTYTGAQGELGAATGTSFAAGKHEQAALVDDSDMLTYTVAGNLDGAAGTIEFWVQPQWGAADGEMHVLFVARDPTGRGIELARDGNGYLHFILHTPGGQDGAGCWINDWRAGEWHHVAVTWGPQEAAVYLDGRQCGQRSGVPPPAGLAGAIYIGSTYGGEWQADAAIDELRISDTPRLGNSDSAGLILVADSGNHRIQAFDALGNFVTAFGGLGSGAGGFDGPQGLAVQPGGNVLVADTGNDRLAVLSFDGRGFGYLGSITAGFRGPAGVAAYRADQIVVADTGNNAVKLLTPSSGSVGAGYAGPAGGGYNVVEYAGPNDGYTGSFSAPRAVAVAPDGNLAVADTGNRRVVMVRVAPAQPPRVWLLPVMRR